VKQAAVGYRTGNRIVDLGWSIKATGLPVGPKTIATGTHWSCSA
jgi:hypothetical protein